MQTLLILNQYSFLSFRLSGRDSKKTKYRGAISATEYLIAIFALLFVLSPLVCHSETDPWAESYRLESLTQYDAAAKSMDVIISNNGSHEFAITRRAWLNYLRGAHNESIRDYQRAIEINSESLEAKLGIMLPLLAQQRWREVSSYANNVLKTAPLNYYAHLRLMIAEEGEKNWSALARHAERMHKVYPSDASILVYLARANDWLKNDKAARKAYQAVLERIPGHIEAAQYLSR